MIFKHEKLLPLLIGFLLTLGCGAGRDAGQGSRLPVFSAVGQVLLDGKPQEGAIVNLWNEETQTTAHATTDARGHFELTTYEPGDGATAGEHQVRILCYEVLSRDDPDAGYVVSYASSKISETRWIAPERYSDYTTSEIEATVTADGKNEWIFRLSP